MSQLQAQSNSTELATLLTEAFGWTASQYKSYVDSNLNGILPDEQAIFFHTARRVQLDPFARQICPVKRWNSKLRRESMSVQVTIDGFRSIAERTGQYIGSDALWCGPDGVWKDVWLEKGPPAAAKVVVKRLVQGQIATSSAVAIYNEYKATDKDGNITKFWRDMAALMIAKVAEALALRKAFPLDLSGLYTVEEMQQAENTVEAPVHQAPAPTRVAVETPVEIVREPAPESVQQTKPEPKSEVNIELINDMQALLVGCFAGGSSVENIKSGAREFAQKSGKKVMGTPLEYAYKAAQAFCLDPTAEDLTIEQYRFHRVGKHEFAVKYLG